MVQEKNPLSSISQSAVFFLREVPIHLVPNLSKIIGESLHVWHILGLIWIKVIEFPKDVQSIRHF